MQSHRVQRCETKKVNDLLQRRLLKTFGHVRQLLADAERVKTENPEIYESVHARAVRLSTTNLKSARGVMDVLCRWHGDDFRMVHWKLQYDALLRQVFP